MELAQAGMKVLMLEAGAHVDPAKDFHHTFLYQMDYRGRGKPGLLRRYAGSERNYRIMLDNEENPYTTRPAPCIVGTIARPRRPHAALGARHRSHGGLRVQGGFARRLRHGLGGLLRRHEAVLRSRRELHRCERRDGRTAAVSRRRVSASHAAQLRRVDFHRRLQGPRLAIDAPQARAIDAPAPRAAALPLLRELREWLRRRRDVQYRRGDAATGAQDRQSRGPHRQRRCARPHEQGEPRAGRHVHRAAHDEVGRRRREIRDPGGLDPREHAAAAAVRQRRPGQLERHPRAIHDGPGRRRRRERNPAQAQGRAEPPRRRESRPASRFRTSRTSTRRPSARTSSAAT